MKLFIIRHGDPDYAHDTLTERGWQEAGLLGERMAKEHITKVYCSPLGRAQDTAKPFLKKTGLVPDTRDFLREFPIPVTQKLTQFGLKDRADCAWDLEPALFEANRVQFTDPDHWMSHPMYLEGGFYDGVKAVWEGLDGILAENGLIREGILYRTTDTYDPDAGIAIFCHMGLGSLLLARLANMAPPHFWQMFRIMPTSVSTVTFGTRGDGLVVSKIFSVGDTTHLAPIGLTYRG